MFQFEHVNLITIFKFITAHDTSNQGNFRSILLYRSNGDEHLNSILQTPGRNKYITPQIQNEIISSCENLILQTIVKKVNDSQCFSVLADETTDISVTEQLALCVRYMNNENNANESFLKFIQVQSLSGKNLADSILNGKYCNWDLFIVLPNYHLIIYLFILLYLYLYIFFNFFNYLFVFFYYYLMF